MYNRWNAGLRLLVMLCMAASAAALANGSDGDDAVGAAPGGVVKVTPLGTIDGEFCRLDRALLFEDPTGLRILYDPGRTVVDRSKTTYQLDPRISDVDIHAIVLSHVHGDHIGEFVARPVPAGGKHGCDTVVQTSAPIAQSAVAQIANAKNAVVIAGGETISASTATFLNIKIGNLFSPPGQAANCAVTAAGTLASPGFSNTTMVPVSAPCVAGLRSGGSRTLMLSGATEGVRVHSVQAIHPNGIPAVLLDAAPTDTDGDKVAPGTPGYGGDASGFVVTFTNGLTVYLSGDTGLFGDMEAIIRRFYKPGLAVINMGDTFSTGADEAALAVRELIRPRSVIPSHSNESSTDGGLVVAGSRLDRFIGQVGGASRVVVPLSGSVFSFDRLGRCVSGCQ